MAVGRDLWQGEGSVSALLNTSSFSIAITHKLEANRKTRAAVSKGDHCSWGILYSGTVNGMKGCGSHLRSKVSEVTKSANHSFLSLTKSDRHSQ